MSVENALHCTICYNTIILYEAGIHQNIKILINESYLLDL